MSGHNFKPAENIPANFSFSFQTTRRLGMAAATTQAGLPGDRSLCLDAVATKDGIATASRSTAVSNIEPSKNPSGVATSAPIVGDAEANEALAKAWADMEDRMYRLADKSKGQNIIQI